MNRIKGIIADIKDTKHFCTEILFCPLTTWTENSMRNTGVSEIASLSIAGEADLSGHESEHEEILSSLKHAVETFNDDDMVLCGILPFLPAESIFKLMIEHENGAVFYIDGNRIPAAFFASAGTIRRCTDLTRLENELFCVQPESPDETYLCRREEFANITSAAKKIRNRELAADGVIIWDAENTYVSPESVIEPGAELLPGCMIYGRSKVSEGAVIGPSSVIESSEIGAGTRVNNSQVYQSVIGKNTSVGPFTYMRAGCCVGNRVRVGDFVEMKNAHIGDDTKISHLTYIGDARVGKRVNFGCGTVTVNYNGRDKHITTIEDGAFIGCNTNLIAPVKVGRCAYTAAGSTITQDVPPCALVVARSHEIVKEDWVKKKKLGRLTAECDGCGE